MKSLLLVLVLLVSFVVSSKIAGTVLPLQPSTQSFTVKNPSNSNWNQGTTVLLQSTGNSRWVTESLKTTLVDKLRSGESTVIQFELPSTSQIGVHTFVLTVQDSQAQLELSSERISLEVTCDDGLFCNGVERFVNGECKRPSKGPCDDGHSCTVDNCDEAKDICSWNSSACSEDCTVEGCIPQCNGLECGGDGCGGFCGTCDVGFACLFGVCEPAVAPGSCSNPVPLVPSNFDFNSYMVVTGDTTGQDNEVIPTCNALSDANDVAYSFTIPQSVGKVGLEARSYSNSVRSDEEYDTVLELRTNCYEPTSKLDCSDDATPPGFLGSRINVLLEPGTYFLIVDGFSNIQFGPYVLELNFHKNCMPLCEGAYCGDDLCGGSCGECASDEICNEFGRCQADPCLPDCEGKSCGDDGCEGNCGTCKNGELCFEDDYECREYTPCDSMLPECQGGCGTNEYCATDCTCRTFGVVGPDIYVEAEALYDSFIEDVQFTPTSCALVENCIGGVGTRKLLKMTLTAVNQGFSEFVPPDPKTRPDIFSYSPCHAHYHFNAFATINLLNLDGDIVVPGSKVGFCIEDSARYFKIPTAPCDQKYDCGFQGIQPGWADIYGYSLDCNWIDVTGIPDGVYKISIQVNPQRILWEESFSNNWSEVEFTIGNPESPASSDTSNSPNSSDSSNSSNSSNSSAVALSLSVVLSFLFCFLL